MAARLLHSLSGVDNPDLEKQIGCMTGIFQLFDRQPILAAGVGHTAAKRQHPNSPGRFHGGGNASEGDSAGKHSDKNILEKQRSFSELSRASFSSSRSSSFSSLDYNRGAQFDPASFDRIIFPETPAMDPEISLKSSSPQLGRRSVDLRDFVKDSMYREVRDSPRLQSKISDGCGGLYSDTRQRNRTDVKESVRVVAQLQEARWCPNEPRGLMRSSSYHGTDGYFSRSVPKDGPRFSCDGREVSREPLKVNDFPRFSLDVTDGPTPNSKSKLLLKSLQQKDSDELDRNVEIQDRMPARPPSVVAKLMGLEALPGPVSSGGANTGSGDKDFVKLSRSLSVKADPSLVQPSGSSKNSWKEPSSPRWRDPEPAPWKQNDSMRSSKKLVSRTTGARARGLTTFTSVYREVEERLKDLEFTRSGRDLRALKQILEAMQSKGFLGAEKGKELERKLPSSKHEAGLEDVPTSQLLGSAKRRTGSSPHYESPIVVMKPANLVGKSGVSSASMVSLDVLSDLHKRRDNEAPDYCSGLGSNISNSKSNQHIDAVNYIDIKADRRLKSTQALTRSRQPVKDVNTGSRKSSELISPRMQQRKLELERRSRPPTPPDSTKSRRQPSKQHGECHSPGSRRRLKYPDGQLNESNVASKSSGPEVSDSVGKKSTPVPIEDNSAELSFIPVEYSSPVSVLDNVVCKDNSPSPIKDDVGKTFQGSCTDGLDPDLMESDSMSGINMIKLQNIDNLVLKLRRLNSIRDTECISSLCDNTDPDCMYISEILVASGLLLRALETSFPFHSSNHPINPDLFSVLEQTKARNANSQSIVEEKLHRKLVFDTVNEILSREFASSGPFPNSQFRSIKLSRRVLNAQKLLRELCSEIEEIRAKNAKCSSADKEEARWQNILCKDVMHQSARWMDFDDGVADAVLSIERLIFKDLVSEIVTGDSTGRKARPGRRRLFAK